MKPHVAFPIARAERTVWVPGMVVENGGVELLSRAQFEALGVTWEAFRERAANNASGGLAAIEPEYFRNKARVIEYAALASDQPIVSALVLAPEFLKKFEHVLGPKLLVAIPSRFAVFIFPAIASNYRDFAPLVTEAYRATPYPVSLEVFEVSAAGIRAIGTYENP